LRRNKLAETNDIKMLVVCILVADVMGGMIYGAKGNIVGIFNCISWAVVAIFILVNFNKFFK
jgi:dihydrodipicolinate synthase/N-acetylneuraminate lyase